jgi:hypothetical protein
VHGVTRRVRAFIDRLIGLADEPTDDDDLRLRKRVTLIAGYSASRSTSKVSDR